ncbi:DNA-binding response regulator, partial [Streptomyces parvus]|nr:DNA-binding response regulator [Streptomyces parvus]
MEPRSPYPQLSDPTDGGSVARIRVLVVDDHRIFAESLAAALAAEPDVDVSAAGSGPAALRALE